MVVSIGNLVHDVETISPLLTTNSIWKSFLLYECCLGITYWKSTLSLDTKIITIITASSADPDQTAPMRLGLHWLLNFRKLWFVFR